MTLRGHVNGMLELFAQTAETDLTPALPWMNLTAMTAMTGLLIWIVTKFLPRVLEDNRTALAEEQELNRNHNIAERVAYTQELKIIKDDSKAERDKFLDSLAAQRKDCRDELRSAREQSTALAESGMAAVNNLSVAVTELSGHFKSLEGVIKEKS